jgi:hypothetical protein
MEAGRPSPIHTIPIRLCSPWRKGFGLANSPESLRRVAKGTLEPPSFSIEELQRSERASPPVAGIIVAAVSVVVMPFLARAKRRVAAGIGSGAMNADSRRADFCTYLSAILLGGLLLNATLDWWWVRSRGGAGDSSDHRQGRGVNGLKGRACACGDGCHG